MFMGAAEGRMEGEVKEGSMRMANRCRLRSWMLAAEHAMNQLLQIFDADLDQIIAEGAKAACPIHGET